MLTNCVVCVAGKQEPINIKSHLGNVIKAGDTVLGYDLSSAM